MGRRAAAATVGISYGSATAFDHGEVRTVEAGKAVRAKEAMDRIEKETAPPKPWEELSPEARRAVEDFDYFRMRYFGRRPIPWQSEAARVVAELEQTGRKEWAVINVPPGSGKSTTFTHDIPVWRIVAGRVRGRMPRTLIGSRTSGQSKMYGRRARSTFERRRPLEGAVATLIEDFGEFQPEKKHLWRNDEMIVWESPHEQPSDEKEPTIMCVGMDTGFLGGRFDLVIWDDLVDRTTYRTSDQRENQRVWFDDEAETRLEPGGLFILMGQRLAPEDLYRYALDKPAVDDDGEVIDGAKYQHVVFPAHDETACTGDHGPDMEPWPVGCLLDPERLSWRDLMTVKEANPRKFEIIMQQKDVDPEGVLVPRVFVDGGEWNGRLLPGCLDHERNLLECPSSAEMISVMSVDPSPTKWWSVQWWLYDPETQIRWLMDMRRAKMDAPDFLDRLSDGEHIGLAVDWVTRARDLGWPIDTIIVEQNAAQRFLLQYDHVKTWTISNGVSIIPHDTSYTNKASSEFGVQTLRGIWMAGQCRIPWGDHFTREAVGKLVDEVTVWPEGQTDDCVMAQWMFEWNLPNLTLQSARIPRRQVPALIRKPTAGEIAERKQQQWAS